jgi:TonB family protein
MTRAVLAVAIGLSAGWVSPRAGFNPQTRAPKPIDCAQDAALMAPLEAAAAAQPDMLGPQLALARCYDTAWRFGDGERVILRAIEIARTSTAQAPDGPVFVGPGISSPGLLRSEPLEYPRGAVDLGLTGSVALEVRIDRQGRVRDVKVAESIPGLDGPAVNTMRSLRFEPPRVNGQPAEIRLIHFARFGLPSEMMPADWLDRSRIYAAHGLTALAIQALNAAMARTRKDLERFGNDGILPFDTLRTNARNAKVQEPTKIKDVRPLYPLWAIERRIEGQVIVEALVDKFGEVGRARIVRPVPMLDAATIDAVLDWVYTPVIAQGKPRVFVMTVTVTFSLR